VFTVTDEPWDDPEGVRLRAAQQTEIALRYAEHPQQHDHDDLRPQRGEFAHRARGCRLVLSRVWVRARQHAVDCVGEGVASNEHSRVGIEHRDGPRV
jgi:hypothetical protein